MSIEEFESEVLGRTDEGLIVRVRRGQLNPTIHHSLIVFSLTFSLAWTWGGGGDSLWHSVVTETQRGEELVDLLSLGEQVRVGHIRVVPGLRLREGGREGGR